MIPGVILVWAGILAAWRPVETHPLTGVVLAGLFLMMVPWTWKRTSAEGFRRSAGLVALWLVFLIVGQAGGWDRSAALAQAFLAGAVMVAIWVASRRSPDNWMIDIFALGLVGLAIWGLWQSLGGLDELRVMTESLPEHLRTAALARIDRGRAFASLLLPSHLAVILATALPILMVRIKRDARGVLFGLAFILGVAGLVATRSPVGVVLALGSCGALLVASRRKYLVWALGIGVAAVAVVVAFRPDVVRLEPVTLRLDNWGSALWVWLGAPIVGVGLGGFGQAAQSVPWAVGNHPAHAHSMPLEMLADLGLFGLAAWIFAMVWLGCVAKRLWQQRPDMAAALLVIPAHNLVDFSLYTSAIALPWAILLGWSLALTRTAEEIEPPVSSGLRWIGVLAGAGAVGVALLALTGFTLKEAARAEASLEQRMEWAGRAALLASWDADAADLVGVIALESGRLEDAQQALSLLKVRLWQRPRSAARAQLTGRLATLAGDPVGGLGSLWRAQEYQPYDGRRREDFETAAEYLERQNSGDR